MKKFFATTKRIDKATGKMILEKVAGASRTRISARAHKDIQRRKNALESSSLPTKLSDCRSDDTDRTELYIVEGDSALGTAKAARNSEFQAILPIRGKILNVQKASLSQMLENNECASIIQVIGAGSGRSFTLEDARYGRVILMSDADVDGAHIRCLLLTLLSRYMRPLIEDGRVFAAMPPLHRIEVIGGKRGEVHYTYSDDEMKKMTADLTKAGKRWKEPIQRYKGLGEMDADQLRETTMDPAHRTLRRITMKDANAAEAMFELLMGNEVAPRKEFISTADIARDRIDA
jgi:DNA gyrase subunit B